ncbi:hypothetical protein NC653_041803 [Populus alba x Populus x berolinensis]|uniref:Uncharacterized protein n=1 Tax=Populus alba x Populus x berolinensis TaxID=444605 RepID=A0AAD6L9F3_9ROSI|nr:hypothetical protein NC653_041803 [Populus alba x Populus x berolinensis]
MPNDAVLDITVHHLFAEDQFNRANAAITATIPTMPPTISRLHDARHCWSQGHKTFSGFIKARERPRRGNRKEKQGARTKTERGLTKTEKQ